MRALLPIVLVAACKYPDPGGALDASDFDGPIDADLVNGAYVVVHTSLDGASTQVAVVRSLDVYGEVDLTGARTFGAGTRVFMTPDEKVFVASDLTVRRFSVVDYSLVEEGPPINFVPTGVSAFSDTFSVLDDTHAWYFDQSRFEAYALDLAAMSSSTAIFYSTLNFTDHEAFVTGAYQVGTTVYVPFHFRQASNPLFVESEMYVARFDATTQALITTTSADTIRSARCSRSTPFARFADTLVILGDIGSLKDLATQPQDPNCLLKIDPATPDELTFFVDMDLQTSPFITATRPVQSGLRVYTWARESTVFGTQAEWDTMSKWHPQVSTFDPGLRSLSTELLTDQVVTMGAPGRTFVLDGAPYLLVPNGAGTSLMTADAGGTFEERATFPGTVTLIERVR